MKENQPATGGVMRLAGFLPYIVIVFLNAFVDLGHKIMVQNTIFKTYDGPEQVVLTAIVNGLILLPFILLMTPAGFLSDKFAKPQVMRFSAAAAVVVTLLITLCYYLGWFWPAFALTFALAVQSALYSPAKYGYIKELVGTEQLGRANGLVQAVTTISILAGTLVFSVLFEGRLGEAVIADKGDILQSIAPLGWALVALSVVEFLLCSRLPTNTRTDTEKVFDWQGYTRGRALKTTIKSISGHKIIWRSIIGLSLFWGIGQVLLAAFPAFAKGELGIDNTALVQGALACSGIGIMIGSLLAGRASRSYIETGVLPIGAITMAVCLLFIPALQSISGAMILFTLLGIGGGFVAVPLNALIQFHAGKHEMGKILAGNNWVQNLVMLAVLVVTAIVAAVGASTSVLFMLVAVVACLGALWTLWKLPQAFARYIASLIIGGRYKLTVQGLHNMPGQGGVLLLGNHISWVDWAIIQIASPRPIRFVMHRDFYERWYLKWFLNLFGAIPIGGKATRVAMERIQEMLNDGEVVCLFPEGVISRTGNLAEFQRGYETAVEGTDAVIVPFYLRGLWGSRFSRSSDRLGPLTRQGLHRDIVVAFGEPVVNDIKVEILKRTVFDLSIKTWQTFSDTLQSIPESWIDSAKRNGSEMCAADSTGASFSNTRLLAAALAFSRRIRRNSPEKNVGFLLPSSTGMAIANMAAMLAGKAIVNLNFTTAINALRAAMENAEVESIYTSKRFVDLLRDRGLDVDAILEGKRIYFLEDLKAAMPKTELLGWVLAARLLPAGLIKRLFCERQALDETAVILFSSGSEGTPKGIMLTHRNIVTNVKQTAEIFNLEDGDVMTGSLPLFHTFGLTVNLFLPFIEGIPVVFHPDPTDVVGISKTIARFRATILCGTSTFFRLYTRNPKVLPLMLDSLRLAIGGAEKVTNDVRDAFKLKFNKVLYEGYGATETSPVASFNMPDCLDPSDFTVQRGCKFGTVGLPIPGTSFRIIDPETNEELPIGEEGMVLIGGVQVMKGYLNNPEKTAEVILERDGVRWYKMGDKGRVDKDGFLTIVDRYSRFAKLGGEMVSLTAVEREVREALSQPELEVAAARASDAKKGEKIVLLVAGDHTQDQIRKAMIDAKCNNLMIPAEVYNVEAVPKLGSGKTDFTGVQNLVNELCQK